MSRWQVWQCDHCGDTLATDIGPSEAEWHVAEVLIDTGDAHLRRRELHGCSLDHLASAIATLGDVCTRHISARPMK